MGILPMSLCDLRDLNCLIVDFFNHKNFGVQGAVLPYNHALDGAAASCFAFELGLVIGFIPPINFLRGKVRVFAQGLGYVALYLATVVKIFGVSAVVGNFVSGHGFISFGF